MPIRFLDVKTESAPLETLANTVLGIDVQHYLSSVMTSKTDSAFEAIGGFPISLKNNILTDIEVLQSHNITPLFVFPGLKTKLQNQYLENTDNLPYEKMLKQLWESKAKNPNSDLNFRAIDNPFFLRSILDPLIEILQDNDIEYLISPFSQIHQLIYMLENGIVNSIYTSNDALLFSNIENFIVGIDFISKNIHFLDSKFVLSNLGCDLKLFREISMISGNTFQPFQLITGNNNFTNLIHNHNTGTLNIKSHITSNDSNKSNYSKGYAILDYCPILKVNGRVESSRIESSDPLINQSGPSSSTPTTTNATPKVSNSASTSTSSSNSVENLPSQLYEVFGNHFPDELYFYQSIGLHLFKYIECLSSEIYVERLPLDMEIEPIYEEVISSHYSMKKKEILFDLLTGSLHRYFQSRKLSLKTYYKSPPYARKIEFKSTANHHIKSLLVRHTTAKSFDLKSILSALDDDYLEECTITNFEPGFISISSNYELISTSLLRTLSIYDFISIESRVKQPCLIQLTKWGLSLTKVINKYNFDIQTTLLLIIFFQRLSDSNFTNLLKPSNDLNLSIKGKVEDDKFLTYNLITKLSTLYNIGNFKAENYRGPVSRSLLHFNSTISVINTELKDFLTVNLLVLLFNNKNDIDKFIRENDDWRALTTEIPFKNSLPNTISGLIIEKTLETSILTEINNEDFKSSLENNLSCFNPIVQNPSKESLKSLKFINSICDLIDVLGADGLVKQNVINRFDDVRLTVDSIISNY